MTLLRQRMSEDMRIRNFSENTQASYLLQVRGFAKYFQKSPELLGPEAIRDYQVYLTTVKKLSPKSIGITVAALRFLYKTTLKRPWEMDDVIPMPKQPERLPVVLSREEVSQFLEAVGHLKHRAILSTMYATGLRITEATHLKPTDIDSQRMNVRVDQGKGQKDRYVMLSTTLLSLLRTYWKSEQPKDYLFPGNLPGRPITRDAVGQMCHKACVRSGLKKPVTPHSLRHAFAVHLLESGTDVRTIQLLLGHRSLSTTARYLKLATNKVCATISPYDLIAPPPLSEPPSPPPTYF
jgi:integrase/recombinase XerD